MNDLLLNFFREIIENARVDRINYIKNHPIVIVALAIVYVARAIFELANNIKFVEFGRRY